MRAKDFLTELGNAPYRYKYKSDLSDPGSEWYFSSDTPNGELLVELVYSPRSKELVMDFSIDQSYEVTNKGDQFKIFSTVLDVFSKNLPNILKSLPNIKRIRFSSVDTASRVSLYKRGAPKISAALGTEWEYRQVQYPDNTAFFIWDKREEQQ